MTQVYDASAPRSIDFSQRYQVYTSRVNVVVTTDNHAEALLVLRDLTAARPTDQPWLWDSETCRRWYCELS